MKYTFSIIVILLAAPFGFLFAQDTTANRDQSIQRIETLEQKIEELEKRISKLEKDTAAVKQNKSGYKTRANWLALEKGMDKKQVKTLLGEPGKILKGYGEFWYYPDSFGGRVEFDADEKVNSWKEP